MDTLLHSLHIMHLFFKHIVIVKKELVSESDSWGKLWFSTSQDNCLILWKLFNQNYIDCTTTMQVTKINSIKFFQVYTYNMPMHCHLGILMVFQKWIFKYTKTSKLLIFLTLLNCYLESVLITCISKKKLDFKKVP